MKATLIAKSQLVGDGFGNGYFRDLYESVSGARISIKTSRTFNMMAQRIDLPTGKLRRSPSQKELFEKYKF